MRVSVNGHVICRFIREDSEDAEAEDRWAVRLAKRYYAKLYREYAIVDLSRYKVSLYGLMTVHSHSPLQAELQTGPPSKRRTMYAIGVCARLSEVIGCAILHI